MIRKLRQRAKKFYQKHRAQTRLLLSKNIYASIGENCLTDAVLQRHNLKSITTPFSHSRSNLDYILQLEASNYRDLLNKNHLSYEHIGETRVVRNRHNFNSDEIYLPLHRNGFEFTHHDVIQNRIHRESYLRKIARLQKYKGKKNYIFFYHYRLCENQNQTRLLGKLIQLSNFYSTDKRICKINVFTQEIVASKQERGLSTQMLSPNIHLFVFKTLDEWAGDNEDLLWARNDDDLFKKMFHLVNQHTAQ